MAGPKRMKSASRFLAELGGIETGRLLGSGAHGEVREVLRPSFTIHSFEKTGGKIVHREAGKLGLVEKRPWTHQEEREAVSLLGRPLLHTRLPEWTKRFKALKKAGANVPEIVMPDYKRNSIFMEFVSAERLVDCNNPEKLKQAAEREPAVIEKLARQLAIAHKAGFSHITDRPLSSLFLVHDGKEYKPVFFDVRNLDRPLFWKTYHQARDVEWIVRNTLSGSMGERFLAEYAKHNPKVAAMVA